jgi:hypothetical protein
LHGPGVSATGGLAWGPFGLSLLGSAHSELPHRAGGERVELELSAYAVRGGLQARYFFAVGQRTAVELATGPRWVRAAPLGSSDPSIRPRAAQDRRWSLGVALSHGVSLGPVGFVLGLSLDVDLVRARYLVLVDGKGRPELVPWQLRPGIFAGVGVW